MMTFAERQHAVWASQPGEQAAIVAGAIEAYQPYDFQPGAAWDDLFDIWRAAPHSHCRAHALAAIVDICHAIEEYKP